MRVKCRSENQPQVFKVKREVRLSVIGLAKREKCRVQFRNQTDDDDGFGSES